MMMHRPTCTEAGPGKMRKVKCGMDRAEICCGMVCKVRNAESQQTYSLAAQGSPVCFAKGLMLGNRV